MRGGRFVDDGGRPIAVGGQDATIFRRYCLERDAVVVSNRLLSNGRVDIKGGSKGVTRCKQGLALSIRFAQRVNVVQILAALDKVEGGDGLKQRTNSDAEESVLSELASDTRIAQGETSHSERSKAEPKGWERSDRVLLG